MKTSAIAVLAGAAILCAAPAQAQTMTKYEGVAFDKNSPDGKWLVESSQGNTGILNTATGEEYTLSDALGLDMFTPGLGLSVTNSGKICGYTMKYAFLWDNGDLSTSALPQPSGVGSMFNGAQGFTADEHRIVGALGASGASLGVDGLMCYPVYWDRRDDGTYEVHTLPYQAKDFSGGTPQSVIAMCVSDDGKTVVGTLVNWTGRYKFPIAFMESASGEWTYKLLGKSEVYDESRMGELPELPEEPKEPDYTQYMSEDDLASYNEAVANYEAGLLDEYPVPGDYISDADQLAAYTAAATQYVSDHAAWLTKWNAYATALNNITTGNSFRQNNLWLSPNGRFLATSLNTAESAVVPGYFDLTEEEPVFHPYTYGDDQSMIASGVLDDGTLFAAQPASEMTRSTVVFPKDAAEPLSFHDYLAGRSETAAAWLKENHTYSVVGTDSIISGTVHVSNDGNVFVAYYTDYYGTGTTQGQGISYVIDLNGSSAIAAPAASRSEQADGVFDLQGRRVAAKPQDVTVPGIYVVRQAGESRKIVVR